VHPRGEPAASGIAFEDALRMGKFQGLSRMGSSEGNFGDAKPKFSSHSFGAHFVEVM
jgi:xanthine dehydrogenase YagR molybdenum-binding subunit